MKTKILAYEKLGRFNEIGWANYSYLQSIEKRDLLSCDISLLLSFVNDNTLSFSMKRRGAEWNVEISYFSNIKIDGESLPMSDKDYFENKEFFEVELIEALVDATIVLLNSFDPLSDEKHKEYIEVLKIENPDYADSERMMGINKNT